MVIDRIYLKYLKIYMPICHPLLLLCQIPHNPMSASEDTVGTSAKVALNLKSWLFRRKKKGTNFMENFFLRGFCMWNREKLNQCTVIVRSEIGLRRAYRETKMAAKLKGELN